MTEQPNTELAQPTSMEDVRERIALRIKASFVELMPEGAWSKMVQGELAEFTLMHAHDYRGNRRSSYLQKIVSEVLEERYREMLKAELAKPEYTGYLTSDLGEPGEFVRALLKENMAAIVTALFERLGQEIVDKVKAAISQDIGTRY